MTERKKIAENLTKEQLQKFVEDTDTWNTFIKLCGYKANSIGNRNNIIKKLEEYNIDYSKFNNTLQINKIYTLDEIYCENSKYTKCLRIHLVKDFNWELRCNVCTLTKYYNLPITIEVDHINGVHNDNRIENLQFLCPNCHSQQDTHRGKNIKEIIKIENKCIDCKKIISAGGLRCDPCYRFSIRRVERPSLQVLEKLRETNSYVAMGKIYKVSDKTIKKWIEGYKKKEAEEKEDFDDGVEERKENS